VENWPFANQEWLATLPGSNPGVRILAYEYTSPFAGIRPSWESILMLGYDLLQHLSAVRSQSGPDVVSEVAIGSFHSSSPRHEADSPSLDYQQANFDSLSQLRWHCSQTGIVHC
jgi:hypothetical protein